MLAIDFFEFTSERRIAGGTFRLVLRRFFGIDVLIYAADQ